MRLRWPITGLLVLVALTNVYLVWAAFSVHRQPSPAARSTASVTAAVGTGSLTTNPTAH